MRIGILTHPLDSNYGCLLQNYALQTTLVRMGHEPITINRLSAPIPFIILLKSWIRRFLLKMGGKKDVSLVWNPNLDIKSIDVLSSKTQLFVKRNIKSTERVYPSQLKEIDRQYKFDAYVVGSDQVWLPHFSLNAFLDFVDRTDVKKIFYGASAGKVSFANYPHIAEQCKKLVSSFTGVSVREDSLIAISRKYLGVEAVQVLDPTLLLDAEDYLKACVEKTCNNPVIFTYILDKTKEKGDIINRVKQELKLPVINGTIENDYEKGRGMDINNCIYPSVDSWLLNMSRSKFVVTDSFHGTCLAIIFHKPFVVVGNVERGFSRFTSLLKLFNMEDRLITWYSDFSDSFYKQLDDDIYERLMILRKESLSYLKDCLN